MCCRQSQKRNVSWMVAVERKVEQVSIPTTCVHFFTYSAHTFSSLEQT